MKRIEKPWGHEDWIFVGKEYVVKRLFMRAGHACSLQFHEEKHETVYVVEGDLDLTFATQGGPQEVHRLQAGDHWVLNPGDIHRMSAVTDCTYLEASTPQLDDVIRLEDSYGRT